MHTSLPLSPGRGIFKHVQNAAEFSRRFPYYIPASEKCAIKSLNYTHLWLISKRNEIKDVTELGKVQTTAQSSFVLAEYSGSG